MLERVSWTFVCVILLCLVVANKPDAYGDGTEPTVSFRSVLIGVAKDWENAIKRFNKGDSAADVDRFMNGKYRDRGKLLRGGGGNYTLCYLVDDYHQVEFTFGGDHRLTIPGYLTARRYWLKDPQGCIAFAVDASDGNTRPEK